MPEEQVFRCTLTPQESARREAADRALAARLDQRWWEGARDAVLTFPLEAEATVHEFVRNESGCCSFFEFDVQRTAEGVRMHVSVPEGGEGMLTRLVDAFEPGTA